jgi:regulation of enolase protein 1 (concanavalin A-like superfamily)
MFKMILYTLAVLAAASDSAGKPIFTDNFEGGLGEGWSWVRENPAGWRTTGDGLELLVEPGNMWGGENSGRNILIRPVPPDLREGVAATVHVENKPTFLYEQVDLVWYYDDSHMVKIGLELVHDQLSLVMGREEGDQTQTLAIIPMAAHAVELRLAVVGSRIRGHFRTDPSAEWTYAGACELPVHGVPHFSIQAYRGSAEDPHWAKVRSFQLFKPATAEGSTVTQE